MGSTRVKEIGIDAWMASTRGKSNDVKRTLRIRIELMMSTSPDSSDGRAAGMLLIIIIIINLKVVREVPLFVQVLQNFQNLQKIVVSFSIL